ncbi:MAG TPA: hypothetical protein VLK58_28410 [Conexibacter sp.]|nr:hypothetical protein [Conexibacter sp.]
MSASRPDRIERRLRGRRSHRRRCSLAACASGVALLGAGGLGLTLDGPTATARADDPPPALLLDASVAYLQRCR